MKETLDLVLHVGQRPKQTVRGGKRGTMAFPVSKYTRGSQRKYTPKIKSNVAAFDSYHLFRFLKGRNEMSNAPKQLSLLYGI